jgi:hypothetical protein
MAKEKTYAAEAKAIMNKYKLRLGEKFDKGDPLAMEAMNQELTALREKQETTRAIEMSSSDFEKALGGYLPKLDGLAPTQDLNQVGLQYSSDFQGDFGLGEGNFSTPADYSISGGSGGSTPFKSRVPWMGAAAGIAESFLGNRQIDFPEYDNEFNFEEVKAERVAPKLVDFSRGREQTQREREQANAIIAGKAKGFGSQSALMESILAGTSQTQSIAGQEFNRSIEQEGNINAQIRNQTSQFNAAQAAQAAQTNLRASMYANDVERENTRMNRQNTLINQSRKDARLKGITDSVTGYTRDLIAADQYDQMLQIMAPDNYSLTSGKDSKLRRFMGISPQMERTFKETGDLI